MLGLENNEQDLIITNNENKMHEGWLNHFLKNEKSNGNYLEQLIQFKGTFSPNFK